MAEVKAAYDIETVAQRLGLSPEHKGGKVVCHCPWHEDQHPSLELNTRGKYQNRYICRACPKDPGEGDIIDLVRRILKLSGDDHQSADTKAALWIKGQDRREPIKPPAPRRNVDAPVINEDLTAFAFQARVELSPRARMMLMRRGLGGVIDDFALGSTDSPGFPKGVLPDFWHEESGRSWKDKRFLDRLVIPYLSPTGVHYVNARALGDQKPKYLKAQTPHKSAESPPYLLESLIAEGVDDIWIAEGELDALSLYAARPDIYACAVPGVNGLNDRYLPAFSGVRVWIITDNDEPGKKARKELERRLQPFARVIHQVHLPDEHNDVNELLVKRGRKFTAGYLEACIKKAVRRTVFRPF